MNKMYKLATYGFLVLATLLCGCVKEPMHSSAEEGRPVTMKASFDTKTTDVEEKLSTLRIAILGGNGRSVYYNDSYSDVAVGSNVNITTTSGVRDIYFFANEPQGSGLGRDDLSDILIAEQQIPYSPTVSTVGAAYVPTSIPMISFKDNEVLEPFSTGQEMQAILFRRMAKITVNLNYKQEEDMPHSLVLKRVQVVDLPKHYYWVNREYLVNDPAAELKDSEIQTATLLDTPATGYDASSRNVFYVPSYTVTGDNRARIKITVEQFVKGTTTSLGEKDYYFAIGHAAATEASSNAKYDLLANYNYNTTITVKGKPTMEVNLLNWTDNNIDGNPNENFSLQVEDPAPEPEPEIRHDYSEHPLRYANIKGVHVASEVTKDLTTVRRVASGDAPLPATTPLTVELITVSTPTGGNIKLRHDEQTTNIAGNKFVGTVGTSDGNMKALDIYFSAHLGEFRYKYKVKLGNISYESKEFRFINGTSGKYMFNSNERQRYIDLGENLGDLNNYTVEVSCVNIFDNAEHKTDDTGEIELLTDAPYNNGTTYRIMFGKDNATPTHWVTKLSDGTIVLDNSNGTGANTAPMFADKYFRLKDNTGKVVLQVVQAAPFYIGRYTNGFFVADQASGTHMCVASYNGYNSSISDATWRRNPSRGSWFSYSQANTYATTWAGDGLRESVGWRLPEYPALAATAEMYSMYDKIFQNTGNRGGSVATRYRWLNPNVNFNAASDSRCNFLPLEGYDSYPTNANGYYWSSTDSGTGGAYAMLLDDAKAVRSHSPGGNGSTVRVVRAVR